MTAGNNGTNAPEGDDPFGYLYRSEDGTPTQAQQPGVPRTSYNQVRAVGERRYGQQAPSPYYAAPETQPSGGDVTRQHPEPSGNGHGQPPQKRNGLLIGALAVVAAVVIGVSAAVLFSDDDKANAGPNPSPTADAQPGEDGNRDGETHEDKGGDKEDPKAELPKEDASSLRLDNGPIVASDAKGAKSTNGDYIAGFNKEGATATWTTEIPEAGKYRLYVGYTVPGKDMKMGLWVNDAQRPQNLNFTNFAKAEEGDWEKGWTYTYGQVNVHEGANTFRISCGKGDACDVAIDRVWLTEDKG
ncbi:carbohydrate-binding protein [Streptomyces gobiensis]|uniref:carbohydrate-binding protein n=1 Tax=Streptomyces gobiensis TaxID=2875706 RepID=UPI001E4D2E3A|nr:carbohydrate-binding protein [Streptomyces gobiensis]UGY92116.1 carbohydrate-binding protein [Streptomyces gobiensis]